MKALFLTNSDEAFELLEGDAYHYGDNGGDPDGNVWLPSGEIDESLAAKVIEAKYGYMVEVEEANDEEISELLGVVRGDLDDEDYEDLLKEQADKQLKWAHYGAYGAMDSKWVYVKPVLDVVHIANGYVVVWLDPTTGDSVRVEPDKPAYTTRQAAHRRKKQIELQYSPCSTSEE